MQPERGITSSPQFHKLAIVQRALQVSDSKEKIEQAIFLDFYKFSNNALSDDSHHYTTIIRETTAFYNSYYTPKLSIETVRSETDMSIQLSARKDGLYGAYSIRTGLGVLLVREGRTSRTRMTEKAYAKISTILGRVNDDYFQSPCMNYMCSSSLCQTIGAEVQCLVGKRHLAT